MPTLGLLLNDTNAQRQRSSLPAVDLVLLERTLFDPPRAGPARRWAAQIRRVFPNAELVPYVWHWVSHGPEDGLRDNTSRSLQGNSYAFGHLQDSEEVRTAWHSALQCYQALDARRVVLRTPPGVGPGVVGRDRIRKFAEARRTESLEVVWEPEGIWEPAEATNFGNSIRVAVLWRGFSAGRPMRDPLNPMRLVHADAWIRVEGVGRRPRLSADQIDAILDHLEAQPNAVVVFSGPAAIHNLEAIRSAL